jgi:hypothetical protein
LLTALKNCGRGFDAVVIGEPQRAFYGNQYGAGLSVFVRYGVQPWVPEVGGAIDPESEAYDLVMSVFGDMSKGNATGSRSVSVWRWPLKHRWKAGFWAVGHPTGIG